MATFATRRFCHRDQMSRFNFSWEGPLEEILFNNPTAFSNECFKEFVESWGGRLRYRCAYTLFRNGIVKWFHRSIKRIAARKRCTVQEAVYWYNITPKDGVPANDLDLYEVRVRGIYKISLMPHGFKHETYKEGDIVLAGTQVCG